jgi:uncharacterized protein YbgA (DUF1722 family)/uncharacterized protein YbbK (DUF523 family)
MPTKIKLGVSSCLLGKKVRYDGGHKRDHFITGTLGKFAGLVPVCPEAECGLGIPREAMRLESAPDGPRLITIRTRLDHTERLRAWAQKRLVELGGEGLWGFIFKSGSPSCGPARVKIYSPGGKAAGTGAGLFAREFLLHFPLVPGEDEARLSDPARRENFLERLITLKRWRDTLAMGARPQHLVDFHARHRLLILSHSHSHSRLLGKLVARIKELPLPAVYEQYQELLLAALRLRSTIAKNVRVLLQVMGHFKNRLGAAEKDELLEIIADYRQGHLPLTTPLTLLNHYVRRYDLNYLKGQHYLHPHPLELRFRNRV